jgi:hypothetical protein
MLNFFGHPEPEVHDTQDGASPRVWSSNFCDRGVLALCRQISLPSTGIHAKNNAGAEEQVCLGSSMAEQLTLNFENGFLVTPTHSDLPWKDWSKFVFRFYSFRPKNDQKNARSIQWGIQSGN